MSRYEGLDRVLRRQVLERDRYRCRWCGATNMRLDLHHVRYRRGVGDDVIDNLISLCRAHHSFVHGERNSAGQTITKVVAQHVLNQLIATPGLTGAALWRRLKRQWALENRCQRHGVDRSECPECWGG